MEHNQADSMLLWESLSQDSDTFQQSMDTLHRKQTGSYYTALKLTLAMMEEMVAGLSDEEKKSLYQKKFLEPCVGTGNFVFAYLRVCKDLGFTTEQYAELLDNIYVCDINKAALNVYARNLKTYASKVFGVELPDEYFTQHIGTGLMFDVDAEEVTYIPITNVFPRLQPNCFDFVVTNPPYKNLKAERSHYKSDEQYEADKAKYTAIGKLAIKRFPYSSAGSLNLYKLFVEEIVEQYATPTGVCSLLIPASILSDKMCAKLRTHILETCSVKSLRIIAENSDCVDASQALCAMLFRKAGTTDEVFIDGSFSGDVTHGAVVSASDFLDPNTGNAILVLSPDEYRIRKQMQKSPALKDIPYIANLRGELDITLNGKSITTDPTPYQLLRGRHVGFYRVNELDNIEYVDPAFVQSTAKEKYIHSERLICQQIVNMAKKRRISFTMVGEESVLANSCNFVALQPNNDGVDYFFLLGVLNSSLIDWFFKLTSSNNHINNYEIDTFPIPIHFQNKEKLSERVRAYMETLDEQILGEIDELVKQAYGIVPSSDDNDFVRSNDVATVFNDFTTCLAAFYQDVQALIPDVDIKTAEFVLRGDKDATFAENLIESLSDFDKKALDNILIKYRKLADGQVLNHTTFKLSDLDLEMIKPVPQGGSWKDIPMETVQKSKRLLRITQSGGRTTLYGRIDYSKPSYTITTYFNRPGNGTYVHPVHERTISVREAARFQCFPDNYLFCGSKGDMLKQVGNAVPVMLAYNIGKAIREKTGCCTSVDLFSGAGGMTYGFKRAGIKAVIANDIVQNACITLKTNNPEIPVYCGDITVEETKKVIINAGVEGHADIICGGPPCQGFSLAGWRLADDPRNQLFHHFVDIVSGVNPKVIVFENVEGLLSSQGGKTYREILELFSELGYNTEGRKLMANHYGAPQRRKRVIILCTRKDIGVLPKDIFPQPITPNADKQVSAYETIYDLESITCADDAHYGSPYSSPMLRYLKSEIDIDDYLSAVFDERGPMENIDTVVTEEDMVEDDESSLAELDSVERARPASASIVAVSPPSESTHQEKPSKKKKADTSANGEQMSMFDLL